MPGPMLRALSSNAVLCGATPSLLDEDVYVGDYGQGYGCGNESSSSQTVDRPGGIRQNQRTTQGTTYETGQVQGVRQSNHVAPATAQPDLATESGSESGQGTHPLVADATVVPDGLNAGPGAGYSAASTDISQASLAMPPVTMQPLGNTAPRNIDTASSGAAAEQVRTGAGSVGGEGTAQGTPSVAGVAVAPLMPSGPPPFLASMGRRRTTGTPVGGGGGPPPFLSRGNTGVGSSDRASMAGSRPPPLGM